VKRRSDSDTADVKTASHYPTQDKKINVSGKLMYACILFALL
jgi:hypothetical protein